MAKKSLAKQAMQFHWQHAMKYKKLAWASFVFAPTTIVIERYIAPLLIAGLLNDLQKGTANLDSSLWLIVGYVGIQLYTQVFAYRINLYAMWALQTKAAKDIYQESFGALTQHSLNFYSNNFAGSLVSQVNRISNAAIGFWNMIVFKVLFVATSILATIIGLSFLIWQYAVVIAILTLLFAIASYYGTRFMRPRFKERSLAYTAISAKLSDSISNMLAVKSDSHEGFEIKRLKATTQNMVRKENKARDGMVQVSSVYALIFVLMKGGALIASIWAAQEGIANIAIIYLALTYTFNLLEELWGINGILRDYYQIVGDSEEMLETMNKPAEITDGSKKKLLVNGGKIILRNVYFNHDKDKDDLFSNFNVTISTRQKVGMVGVSGSGKTTLTKLLLRFMDVDSGSIEIDKQDIKQVTQKSLRQNIAYVPQEPLLFHRSLAENIAYGKPNATQKEIEKAAKLAHAAEFIEKLPNKYETLVGERGVKLSGGQRQRIAIARAILKDAPILVLDEATSALDSESEKLIQDALTKLMKNRTSIVIAHRLSTIQKMDRIIVLDKGKIVEEGSHKELLAKKGTYAKLWAHQSGGFIEE